MFLAVRSLTISSINTAHAVRKPLSTVGDLICATREVSTTRAILLAAVTSSMNKEMGRNLRSMTPIHTKIDSEQKNRPISHTHGYTLRKT